MPKEGLINRWNINTLSHGGPDFTKREHIK